MSQWAHEHPEDPEGAWEAMLEAADNLRKYRKEHPEADDLITAADKAELDHQSLEEAKAAGRWAY